MEGGGHNAHAEPPLLVLVSNLFFKLALDGPAVEVEVPVEESGRGVQAVDVEEGVAQRFAVLAVLEDFDARGFTKRFKKIV